MAGVEGAELDLTSALHAAHRFLADVFTETAGN